MTRATRNSSSSKASAGDKHKADSQSLPKPKRGTAADGTKEQITLEETLDSGHQKDGQDDTTKENGSTHDEEKVIEDAQESNGQSKGESPPKQDHKTKQSTETKHHATEVEERDEDMPTSMMEKGLIYFFIRPRVNMTNPHAVEDMARTYIVLRPLPLTAKLTDDSILATESSKNRILALPKKVLPAGGQDRFMFFVEKANKTISEIKTFLATTSDDNASPAIPAGEGIYALTSTNNSIHLSYILTLPQEPSKVQHALRLSQRGHYTLSAKNPTASAPANTALPNGPGYPKDILDIFHGRAWSPPTTEMFGYENAQFLIIGSHGRSNVEVKDQEEGGDQAVVEEMEKLEDEDEARVQGLGAREKDRLFAELGVDIGDVRSTW